MSGERVADLLEQLRTMIQSAKWIPIGADKCIIDRGAALDLLEEARQMFPQELDEAQRLVAAKSDFIARAKREAEEMRRAAEERSRQLVDEQEVLRIAKTQSRDLLVSAETNAETLRRTVTVYVDETLRRTEESLSAALDEMKNSRARFGRATEGQPAQPETPPESSYDIDIEE
ncbi:MAG: hypothetical protein LBN99_01095 [Oscillospiraceae bacterium]|jgi:hypothetical protein|nr:hypothetical protein [Oscillospiraceae bacterium]